MVCLRNICINTLHRGDGYDEDGGGGDDDNDDDDDDNDGNNICDIWHLSNQTFAKYCNFPDIV